MESTPGNRSEVIPLLPYEEYAGREGTSASLLKLVASETLLTVKATLDGKINRDSDAKTMGAAFHALLLEGRREYVMQPLTYVSTTVKKGEDPVKPWNNNSHTCKAWYAEQTLPVLDAADVANLEGMDAACRSHPSLAHILGGKYASEVSVFAEKDGRKLKARIDLLPDDPDAPVLDFKKSRSANPSKFIRQAFDLYYHLQAAFYLDVLRLAGIPRKQFWFVAVESVAPFNVSIIKMTDEPISFIELGRREWKEAYRKLMTAKDTDCWPTYGEWNAETELPSWISQAVESTA